MARKEVILPGLGDLTSGAKERLIMIADVYAKTHRDVILHYLETGEVQIEELHLLDRVPEIKAWLIDEYNKWRFPTDPQEQTDRAAIKAKLPASPSEIAGLSSELRKDLFAKLSSYIEKYDTDDEDHSYRPLGNIVDEVYSFLAALKNADDRDKEKSEWDRVNKNDYSALLNYLRNHPETPFFTELDDTLWALVKTEPVDVNKVRSFMKDLPRSTHLKEAEAIIGEYDEWETILRTGATIDSLCGYLSKHPTGMFKAQALGMMERAKQDRLEEIKKSLGRWSFDDYQKWLSDGVLSKSDFTAAGLVTDASLVKLRELPGINRDLDLSKSDYICPPGATDVFFFGIPSTGKTCVLMGLLKSNPFWNAIQNGGKYGGALVDLCEKGVTPSRTKGDFATLIKGEISDTKDSDVVHLVNFIDMGGEGFADKIAHNVDEKVSIEDLGEGIPQMLRNSNDKVFFIVIDPTTDEVKFRKELPSGGSREVTVRQQDTLHRFMTILDDPSNEDIMKKVKAIHIVATKADCLGNRDIRQEKAKEVVTGRYDNIIAYIKKISKKYDINIQSSYKPRLYSFSLGEFYLGGVFDYVPTDSKMLLELISRLTVGNRRPTLWSKIRKWFN